MTMDVLCVSDAQTLVEKEPHISSGNQPARIKSENSLVSATSFVKLGKLCRIFNDKIKQQYIYQYGSEDVSSNLMDT